MQEQVLIIDDDVSILAAFAEILTEYGHTVDTAEDEVTALDKMHAKKYDIAIVDMVLKETKGIDLIVKIQERFQDIVVVAITGYPPEDYVVNSIRQGAVEFLTKPCEREDLVAAICRGLTQRRNRENSQKTTSFFPWQQIIRENPSCVDTILRFAKRKIDKEIFKKVKTCERNFVCLFSDTADVCPVEDRIGDCTCFIAKETERACESENQFTFGFSHIICSCPIRAELHRKRFAFSQ